MTDDLTAWRRDAACAGQPIAIFYPAVGMGHELAAELCGRCPVRAECLAEALADPELDHGWRGGMSAQARKARRRLERKRARVFVAVVPTDHTITDRTHPQDKR